MLQSHSWHTGSSLNLYTSESFTLTWQKCVLSLEYHLFHLST